MSELGYNVIDGAIKARYRVVSCHAKGINNKEIMD